MPLTPQDVHSKVFGPTRFRRGYDEGEVDAFLDEVEVELTRLHREIDSLRAQVGSPRGEADSPPDVIPADGELAGPGRFDEEAAALVEPPHAAAADAAPAIVAASAPPAAGSPATDEPADLEQRVARALVLAQRAADEAIRDAERQADELRAAAAAEAER